MMKSTLPILAIAMAGLTGFGSLSEASARQFAAGGGAGFGVRGGAGGFAAPVSGGRAPFAVRAMPGNFGVRAVAPAVRPVASYGYKMHSGGGAVFRRRGHHRGFDNAAAFIGVPLIGYGYGYVSSYNPCAWLWSRYEETGLRQWRLRHQACRGGDDY